MVEDSKMPGSTGAFCVLDIKKCNKISLKDLYEEAIHLHVKDRHTSVTKTNPSARALLHKRSFKSPNRRGPQPIGVHKPPVHSGTGGKHLVPRTQPTPTQQTSMNPELREDQDQSAVESSLVIGRQEYLTLQMLHAAVGIPALTLNLVRTYCGHPDCSRLAYSGTACGLHKEWERVHGGRRTTRRDVNSTGGIVGESDTEQARNKDDLKSEGGEECVDLSDRIPVASTERSRGEARVTHALQDCLESHEAAAHTIPMYKQRRRIVLQQALEQFALGDLDPVGVSEADPSVLSSGFGTTGKSNTFPHISSIQCRSSPEQQVAPPLLAAVKRALRATEVEATIATPAICSGGSSPLPPSDTNRASSLLSSWGAALPVEPTAHACGGWSTAGAENAVSEINAKFRSASRARKAASLRRHRRTIRKNGHGTTPFFRRGDIDLSEGGIESGVPPRLSVPPPYAPPPPAVTAPAESSDDWSPAFEERGNRAEQARMCPGTTAAQPTVAHGASHHKHHFLYSTWTKVDSASALECCASCGCSLPCGCSSACPACGRPLHHHPLLEAEAIDAALLEESCRLRLQEVEEQLAEPARPRPASVFGSSPSGLSIDVALVREQGGLGCTSPRSLRPTSPRRPRSVSPRLPSSPRASSFKQQQQQQLKQSHPPPSRSVSSPLNKRQLSAPTKSLAKPSITSLVFRGALPSPSSPRPSSCSTPRPSMGIGNSSVADKQQLSSTETVIGRAGSSRAQSGAAALLEAKLDQIGERSRITRYHPGIAAETTSSSDSWTLSAQKSKINLEGGNKGAGGLMSGRTERKRDPYSPTPTRRDGIASRSRKIWSPQPSRPHRPPAPRSSDTPTAVRPASQADSREAGAYNDPRRHLGRQHDPYASRRPRSLVSRPPIGASRPRRIAFRQQHGRNQGQPQAPAVPRSPASHAAPRSRKLEGYRSPSLVRPARPPRHTSAAAAGWSRQPVDQGPSCSSASAYDCPKGGGKDHAVSREGLKELQAARAAAIMQSVARGWLVRRQSQVKPQLGGVFGRKPESLDVAASHLGRWWRRCWLKIRSSSQRHHQQFTQQGGCSKDVDEDLARQRGSAYRIWRAYKRWTMLRRSDHRAAKQRQQQKRVVKWMKRVQERRDNELIEMKDYYRRNYTAPSQHRHRHQTSKNGGVRSLENWNSTPGEYAAVDGTYYAGGVTLECIISRAVKKELARKTNIAYTGGIHHHRRRSRHHRS